MSTAPAFVPETKASDELIIRLLEQPTTTRDAVFEATGIQLSAGSIEATAALTWVIASIDETQIRTILDRS